MQEQAFDRAVFIGDVAIEKNSVVDGGKTDIPVAGTIIGKVKKHGQSNHLGIDVFVPGVSGFLVKTAADGSFSLKAPVGTVPVAFKADSYRTIVRHFEVKSGEELDIGEIVLAVGTLGANQVLINNGDEASSSLTVTVQVGASEDAIRMKVSETKDFSGKSWQELKPVFTYTFSDYPDEIGNDESQICVSIENEDGSEVSSCDTIYLDPFSTGGKLFKPSFDVPSTVKASDGKILMSNIVVPKVATQMHVQYGRSTEKLVTPSKSLELALSGDPADCRKAAVTAYFLDKDGNKSVSGSIDDVTIQCWAPTATSGAPSARRLGLSWDGTQDHVLHAIATGSNSNDDFANKIIYFGSIGSSGNLSDGAIFDPEKQTWTLIPSGEDGNKENFSVVWTGDTGSSETRNRLLIWGGKDQDGNLTNLGQIYDVEKSEWSNIDSTDAPDARYGHVAAWTGSKMFIFGGHDETAYLNSGALYDIATKEWTSIDTTGGPGGVAHAGAVVADGEVYVYGGLSGDFEDEPTCPFRLYKYGSDGKWETLQQPNTVSTVHHPVMHYTGSTGSNDAKNRIILVGGYGCSDDQWTMILEVYDIATNTWSLIDPDFAFAGTYLRSTFADGRLFLFNELMQQGAYYDFETKTWHGFANNSSEVPIESDFQSEFSDWDRKEFAMTAVPGAVVFWGGIRQSGSPQLNTGAFFYPFPRQ